MQKIVDVLVSGRVYSDLIFTGVRPPASGTEVYADGFALSPGGAANRAVAAARLGASTALLSEFGDDPIGREVLGMLRDEPGLDLSACVHRAEHPSPLTVSISSGDDRAFVTYEEPERPPTWPRDAAVRVAHVGVGRARPRWVDDLRADGTVLIGGVGWDATETWSAELLDALTGIDVLIVNEVEALGYTRADDPERAVARLAEHVDTAVVTLGERGAIALSADGALLRVAAPPVPAADPTGAGDVFAAAFGAATAWRWPLEDRLRLAAAAGAASVTGRGGALSSPHPHDIARLVADADPEWSAVREWARTASAIPIEGVRS